MTKEKEYQPWSAKQEAFGKFFIKRIGKWQTAVYEATGGRLWNKFLGVHCAILTTTGRKTGEARKTPLLYLQQGDEVVMVASQGGFSTEPFWYKNIQANPEVFVQIGANKRAMRARNASDEEKQELWPKLDAIYEGYKEYRARTKNIRVIPIVIFSPI
jgi:deazaflavin-dependent oxidoreductase (nitroreductase family)